MRLIYQLLIAPMFILATLIVFGGYAWVALGHDRGALNSIQTQRHAAYRELNELGERLDQIHIDALRLISWINVYDEKTVASRSADLKQRMDALTEALNARDQTHPDESLAPAVGHYAQQVNDSIDLAGADVNTGLAKMQTADVEYSKIKDHLKQLSDDEGRLAMAEYESAIAQALRFQQLSAGFVLIAAIIGILLVRFSVRRIQAELGGEPAVVRLVGRNIAAGDLSSIINPIAGDQTSVLAAMNEIQTSLRMLVDEIRYAVAAGSAGDFSHRVSTLGLSGFGLELATLLNALLSSADQSVKEVCRVMSALAEGDLSQRMHGDYTGAFEQMQSSVNQSCSSLSQLMDQLRLLTRQASAGVLTGRMPTENQSGYQRELANEINALVATAQTVLGALSGGLHALAKGDLSQRINLDVSGSFAIARDDFNIAVERLAEMVHGIQQASDIIADAAAEIAHGNNDLAERSEKTVATIRSATQNMNLQAESILQSADHSRQAREIALGAADTAARGGSAVTQVVGNMGQISQTSNRIRDIIGIIDGIAFQTNILALNAAVESARAGEHGRGFAVVASEVRGLAQRSADAAKEIKVLIEGAVGQVSATHEQAEEAGRVMHQIVADARRVAEVITQVAEAARTQGAGVEQFNRAFGEVERDVQQNAERVEQAAASAAQLDEQARALASTVKGFVLTAAQAANPQSLEHAPPMVASATHRRVA